MDPLQLREKEAFDTMSRLSGCNFVLIGGYAVSSYAAPRFSVDCDIVVEDASEYVKNRRDPILTGIYQKGNAQEF